MTTAIVIITSVFQSASFGSNSPCVHQLCLIFLPEGVLWFKYVIIATFYMKNNAHKYWNLGEVLKEGDWTLANLGNINILDFGALGSYLIPVILYLLTSGNLLYEVEEIGNLQYTDILSLPRVT